MEIDNAIEEFINFVRVEREYSEHSVTAYAKDLSELSIYAHDEKVPDDVKSLDFFTLRGFITTLYDRELSKSSIERKISTIKSFFKFLYRRGFIEENPARMLKFPKKEKYLPTVFNVDDIFTLLDLPDKTTPMGMRDALILELLYGTGVRVSELVGLDRSAVDLNGMRILVRGKGKKERIVPLAPELISLIKDYYKVMYDIVADNRIVDSDALIINRLGTRMTDRTVRRVVETYLKKGYSREWINQRLQAIQVRKELTDEWTDRGVKKGREFAILTDEITRAWSGLSTRQYKDFKGLKKENLRDNMSTTELVLNMLAETSTKDISKAEKPETFEENVSVAKAGGGIAGIARKALEERIGKSVITSENAVQLNAIVSDMIESSAAVAEERTEDENDSD